MLQIVFVLFGVLISGSVFGQDTSIRYISKSEVVKPGTNVNLTCEYYIKMGSIHRRWVRNNGKNVFQDISLNDIMQVKDDRYSVHTYLSRGKDGKNYRMYSLMIKNVNFNENGTYECRIFLDNGKVISKALSLVVFPSDKLHRVALQGDDAHLECFDKGYVLSDIKWTRKNTVSLPNGSISNNNLLIIPSVGLPNSGLYTCSAKCSLSNQTSRVTQDIVLDVVPPLDIQVRNHQLIRPLGYNVNITCFIYSSSLVAVVWSKDNKPVSQSPRHEMLLYYSQGDGLKKHSVIVSQLILKSITKDDYGEYKCDVENDFTFMSEYISLRSKMTRPSPLANSSRPRP